MIKSVKAYAATSATAPLALYPISRRTPRPDDVEIDILYCGVCHSDLHTARNDWGWTHYPIVPGHEIIGRVVAVGSQVSKFKVGDQVGVGCMVDSCGHCDACTEGHEQHCSDSATYTYGAPDRIDGSLTQARLRREGSGQRVVCGAHPRQPRVASGRAAAVCRYHHLVTAQKRPGRSRQPWLPS